MSTHPLSHHEIVELVEPFSRAGRPVDLAASQRLERRLAFKPLQRHDDGLPPLVETLALHNPEPGSFVLSRTLALAGEGLPGLAARLQAEGPSPGDLLARIAAVPARRQWLLGAGYTLALSHTLAPATAAATGPGGPAGAAAPAAPPGPLTLLQGVARVDGLKLTLTMSTVRGSPADLLLEAPFGETLPLPDDLLAVLGWSWTRLDARNEGWLSQLRLRGQGPARSADAEHKLARTVEHLARTLAEPPARFHDQRIAARWGVTFRRAIPLLVSIGLIAAAAAVPRLAMSPDSVMRMLILNAPPLLLMMFFTMREIPRIEIPPWPRRPVAPAWRQPQAAPGVQAPGPAAAPSSPPQTPGP